MVAEGLCIFNAGNGFILDIVRETICGPNGDIWVIDQFAVDGNEHDGCGNTVCGNDGPVPAVVDEFAELTDPAGIVGMAKACGGCKWMGTEWGLSPHCGSGGWGKDCGLARRVVDGNGNSLVDWCFE